MLKGSPVFLDGVFQTGIVFHFFKTIFDISLRPFGGFSVNGTDLFKWYTRLRDVIYQS